MAYFAQALDELLSEVLDNGFSSLILYLFRLIRRKEWVK